MNSGQAREWLRPNALSPATLFVHEPFQFELFPEGDWG